MPSRTSSRSEAARAIQRSWQKRTRSRQSATPTSKLTTMSSANYSDFKTYIPRSERDASGVFQKSGGMNTVATRPGNTTRWSAVGSSMATRPGTTQHWSPVSKSGKPASKKQVLIKLRRPVQEVERDNSTLCISLAVGGLLLLIAGVFIIVCMSSKKPKPTGTQDHHNPTPHNITYVPCPFCQQSVSKEALESHKAKCPKANCQFCGKNFSDSGPEALAAHEAICPRRSSNITYKNCRFCHRPKDIRILPEHEHTCPYRKQCEFCDLYFPADEIDTHRKSCGVECPYCHDLFSKSRIADHKRTCPERQETNGRHRVEQAARALWIACNHFNDRMKSKTGTFGGGFTIMKLTGWSLNMLSVHPWSNMFHFFSDNQFDKKYDGADRAELNQIQKLQEKFERLHYSPNGRVGHKWRNPHSLADTLAGIRRNSSYS